MKAKTRQLEESILIVAAIILTSFALLNVSNSVDDLSKITGAAITRANISPALERPCNFTVQEGLNLVSFFCITRTEPRENVVANITQLKFIFEYQEDNLIDPWKSYNPSLGPQYQQDLSSMSRTEGYWIDMNASETILIDGGLRVPTTISLLPGWNLAGYPTNKTKDTNESLQSISGNYTEIRGFNATTKSFVSFIPPNTGGLRNTTTYEGYWINATVSGGWVVD